ncbi:vWA domain-containing protein [Nocardioides humi]|uniref:VWA domain-containing protein n=1 Tax=Nocardioides humi TaxID=449461 RepID=A0ABN2ALL0_9ACTN|nr:VWA domain-containing protein [Nocardioides humi]
MAEPDPEVLGRDFVQVLVGFGRALRDAGLTLGSGDLLTYGSACALLDPADLVDVYWSGRTTLVTRRDQLPAYDAVFRRYFLDEPDDDGEDPAYSVQQRAEASATLQLPDPEATESSEPGDEREARMGLMASDAATVRHRSFSECTPEELLALRRLMRRIRLVPPRRRSRRTRPAGSGPRPDLRRVVRTAVRHHGELDELAWRRRRLRNRPLVLVLDVSGSMADYSRALLQFAHGTSHASRKVEVFCFGTRLTRITRQLEHRRPDDALRAAAAQVVDWEGGTRIGDSLAAFVRDYGRRGMSRGAVVVICSDGLDRGDPAVLDGALQRLSRLCHRIVWLNPHKGDQRDFVPSTLGMMVAAPYVDELLSGHDLASLEELAAVLPRLR